MPNWYLQFDFSRLGCQRARVQPAATVPNEKQQVTSFRETPELHNPIQQMNFSILQNTSDTWMLVPALHGVWRRDGAAVSHPKSCLMGVSCTHALMGILRVLQELTEDAHEDDPAVGQAWPAAASGHLEPESFPRRSVGTPAWHIMFAVKPGTIPGRAGCTVASCFLQNTMTCISFTRARHYQTCQTMLWGQIL